jgi:hypothetical protein
MAVPTTTVGSKLVLSVKDFQAVGDGITDDTRPFTNALHQLAANNGGTLLIPPGTYLVGDVKLGSGIFLKGTGTPLPVLMKAPSAVSVLSIVSDLAGGAPLLHDISVEQLTLRGRSVQDGFSEHAHNLVVRGVDHLAIHSVSFEAFQGDGLYLGTLHEAGTVTHNLNINVTGNTFDGVNAENRNGVSVIDCDHCVIERNTFVRLTRPDMPGAIDLEPNHQDEFIHDVALINNTITSNHGSVGAIAVELAFKDFLRSPGHILIENNQIQDSVHGIVVAWSGSPTSTTPSLDMLVWRNVVKNTGHVLTLDGVAGVTVAQNAFSDSSLDLQLGTSFGASSVHFKSNSFVRMGSASGHAVVLSGPLSFVDFDSNNFTDLGSPSAGGSAIHFAGGSAGNVTYTNNVFSSPNQITHVAISSERNVVFAMETNIWHGNTLHDGIQLGTFPHGSGFAPVCE